MKVKWWFALIMLLGLGVSSLAAANHTHTTLLPLVYGPVPVIINGDFEHGPVGWAWNHQLSGINTHVPPPIFQYPELGVRPASGEWAARLTQDISGIQQTGIVVPHDRPYLRYWRLVRRGTGGCDPNFEIAYLTVSGGGWDRPDPVFETINMCTSTEWEQRTLNLSAWAGRTVYIQSYVAPNRGAFYLDDFRFVAQP